MPPERETGPQRRGPVSTKGGRNGHGHVSANGRRPAGRQKIEQAYACPVCDGPDDLKVSHKPSRDSASTWIWLYVCNRCYGGREYLEQVAEACSERDGQWYRWTELQDGPPVWLGEPVEESRGRRSGDGTLDPLPSADALANCHGALMAGGPPLDYLTEERGLTLETISELQIGYAESGVRGAWGNFAVFTLPVYTDFGRLMNVRKRFWPRLPKSKGEPVKGPVGLRGRGSQLYPWSPDDPKKLIVCEGEFDAALLIQHGFPAVTSTASTSWDPNWNGVVRDKYVAVIYDAGRESLRLAQRRAAEFQTAGAKAAWVVDLRRAGLRLKQDVTDFFVTYGKTADELRQLINSARKETRD